LVRVGSYFMVGQDQDAAAAPLGIKGGALYFRGRIAPLDGADSSRAAAVYRIFPQGLLDHVFRSTAAVDDATAATAYERVRSVAVRRGSLFLAVMLTCDIDVQVGRIANPDRVALRKGSDPEGYRGHRLTTTLFQPPAAEVLHLDTTHTPAADNAALIHAELIARGFSPGR
jgi:hypothetical protein